MNTNQTIRDLTIAYIENALSEVALLHDAALIGPTLEKFHIERDYARFHGFTPKQGRFNPHAGFKPRAVYTVTDGNGTPLGESIHEGDLGARYAEAVIERQIVANLEAMLTDHADLVALHRAGDGGAAPSLRYRPASSLAERTDTEATLERQKTILRTEIEQLREQHETGQARIRATLRKRQETENALEDAKRSLNSVLAKQQEAQK
ncbi:MAG: hypothetical protein E6Q57_09885, partial [Mycobacterium sp.]